MGVWLLRRLLTAVQSHLGVTTECAARIVVGSGGCSTAFAVARSPAPVTINCDLRVRWLLQAFQHGPQFDSHSHTGRTLHSSPRIRTRVHRRGRRRRPGGLPQVRPDGQRHDLGPRRLSRAGFLRADAARPRPVPRRADRADAVSEPPTPTSRENEKAAVDGAVASRSRPTVRRGDAAR